MQIADFIIGLLGHLWLQFHHVWLVISIQTKEAENTTIYTISCEHIANGNIVTIELSGLVFVSVS